MSVMAGDQERMVALLGDIVRDVSGFDIGADANFFEAGLTSELLLQVQRQVVIRLGREVAVPVLFKYPTRRSLARHLCGAAVALPEPPRVQTMPGWPVAQSRRELRNRIRNRDR